MVVRDPEDVSRYDEELGKVTIGGARPLERPIEIRAYDPRWPLHYEREEARIRSVLGDRVLRLEHVGSTAVPDLPAKPVIDIALEVADRPLDLPRAGADGTRHPVERAELVDDRAPNPGDGVGLELDVPVGVVPLDRADQAEKPVRDEILLLHVSRKAASEPAGDVLHERRVCEDEAIAERLVVGSCAEGSPEGSGVVDLRHPQTIRT